jgi:ribosomal protein L37E
MKPEINITDNEIVISTDNYNLMIRFTECYNFMHDTDPIADWRKQAGSEADHQEQDAMKHAYCEAAADKVAEANHGLEEAIEDYKERHPEQFPSRKNNKRKTATYARVCPQCGNDFTAYHNITKYCPACASSRSHKKRLSDQNWDELDKTLAEIESRRKKKYEFGND